MYYMRDSEDSSIIKSAVAAIWILDTLHVSFMCHMLYYYLIANYGDLLSLEYVVWSLSASLLVNTLVLTIVQFYFAHTIYCLCRRQPRWLVTAPIMLLVLAELWLAIATVIELLVNNALSFASHIRFYTAVPVGSVLVAAEVLLTVSLCVLLHGSGSHSAIPRTKCLLNTLIIYAVNRCLLTLLVIIARLIVDADDIIAWAIALDFIAGKLYANSFLASLNTRQHLRSRGSESHEPVNVVHFAKPPKLLEDGRSSKDGERHSASRREGEV